MPVWWERFPGRLEWEIDDFRARGLDFYRDEALFRDSGRLLLRGTIAQEAGEIELEVLYPDVFPYIRPEVYAPKLALRRHQNPATHNLCLLRSDTGDWDPSNSGAWLVAERVPLLLSLLEGDPDDMASAEAPQGEPVSAYFSGIAGTVIFVPSTALELAGELRAGSGRLCFAPEAPPRTGVRALLCELVVRSRKRKTKLVARADEPLAARFGGEHVQMRWVRLENAPAGFDAEAIFVAADEAEDGFGRPPWQSVVDGDVAVTGVVFPEEVRQGVWEDAWLFGVRARRVSGGQTHESSYVIRGERLTSEDFAARIPKLSPLKAATVAQVGLGALGGPLALDFARNQVSELRLLEHDHVEAAQTVRWPLGLEAVGHYKLEVLASFIDRNYPYTRAARFPHRIGETALQRRGRTENELGLLARFLAGASIVVDASAEIGVQQVISDLAQERGLLQIYLSATEGARGGQVALIVPGRGGCWYCWKQHALEGTVPLPPSEGDVTVQPRGCASPTFTGASFDLLPVQAQAARMTAAALTPGTGLESCVWICSLADEAIRGPDWEGRPIAVHSNCPVGHPPE